MKAFIDTHRDEYGVEPIRADRGEVSGRERWPRRPYESSLRASCGRIAGIGERW